MKPKDDKETSKSIKEVGELTEKVSERISIPSIVKLIKRQEYDSKEKNEYIPKSECLMTTFYLLTNKSFPRKGPGKSTRVKMLDAIIMAAINKKLILQGA